MARRVFYTIFYRLTFLSDLGFVSWVLHCAGDKRLANVDH